mmetsp:Transcript_87608/g.234540  ORF Transcript_87608/g.234540 Transcript_87608/m.234540 type:complete len:703 (-) Transcript_87608:83-2191(-)
MGNIECVGSGGFDGVCVTREFPSFVVPFSESPVYHFDGHRDKSFPVKGKRHPSTGQGFVMDSTIDKFLQRPTFYTVMETSQPPKESLVVVAGRVFVNYSAPVHQIAEGGVCIFAVCIRGVPLFEHVSGPPGGFQFPHDGSHKFDSGLFVSFFLTNVDGQCHVAPTLALVTEQLLELNLMDEVLGPVPESFYIDFAIVDQGGRNIQLDVIVRCPGPERRTLRKLLADHTTFHDHVHNAAISIGYSHLNEHVSPREASAVLQNLSIAEQQCDGAPVMRPFPVFERRNVVGHVVQYEGEDSCEALGVLSPHAPDWARTYAHDFWRIHPQIRSLAATWVPDDRPPSARAIDNWKTQHGYMTDSQNTGRYWHHIQYTTPKDGVKRSSACGAPLQRSATVQPVQPLAGEFWVTKQDVDRSDVLLHTSTTLAQALTVGILFRFTCPQDYLTLIEAAAADFFTFAHIPTNAIVCGVSEDAEVPDLIRMFVEMRNQVVNDMVICECPPGKRNKTLVHQEVYDRGSEIRYRVIVVHADGSRQTGELVIQNDTLDEVYSCETERIRGAVDAPSARFPISPTLPRHELAPVNRIMLFTSAPYTVEEAQKKETSTIRPLADCSKLQNGGTGTDGMRSWNTSAMVSPRSSRDEFQSPKELSPRGLDSNLSPTAADWGVEEEPADERWLRPLVESVVVARCTEPPFDVWPALDKAHG